jgi:hypothetical protein
VNASADEIHSTSDPANASAVVQSSPARTSAD